jgi:hypothetical protein
MDLEGWVGVHEGKNKMRVYMPRHGSLNRDDVLPGRMNNLDGLC